MCPSLLVSHSGRPCPPQIRLGWLHRFRCGQPEEFTAAVASVVSPEASYISGAALNVDGGYTVLTRSPHRQKIRTRDQTITGISRAIGRTLPGATDPQKLAAKSSFGAEGGERLISFEGRQIFLPHVHFTPLMNFDT